MDIKIILSIVLLMIFLCLGCANDNLHADKKEDSKNYVPNSAISKLYPEDNCCCEFSTGDILNEELMLVSDCQNKGKCIEVDPLRYTPHSCCPNAPGERCNSLINQQQNV